jgi:hypothetical protein
MRAVICVHWRWYTPNRTFWYVVSAFTSTRNAAFVLARAFFTAAS